MGRGRGRGRSSGRGIRSWLLRSEELSVRSPPLSLAREISGSWTWGRRMLEPSDRSRPRRSSSSPLLPLPDDLTRGRQQMQSLAKSSSPNRPAKPTIANTFSYIYHGSVPPPLSPQLALTKVERAESGVKGLFRGVTPRLMLGVWRVSSLVVRGRGGC